LPGDGRRAHLAPTVGGVLTLRRLIAEFRQRHVLAEWALLRRLLRRAGYHLVRATYYSPIPDIDEIPPGVWQEPAPMPAVEFDIDAQLSFVEREIGPFLTELNAPALAPGTAEGYYSRNEFFNALDAEVLHAIVRTVRPARVLEVGSGYSTLVIAGAARRNDREGAPVQHTVYDPFPSQKLDAIRDRIDLHPLPATEIEAAQLSELRARDVLFIDTTHTVKPGGDVVRLVLELLPTVAPGVLVHIHDFFRPFEYPRVMLERFGLYWQEHHLVQALLAFNCEFEVLCANHALSRLRRRRILELVPSLDDDMQPSSLWLRRRSGPDDPNS
jgi:hypothetical protein